MRIEDLHIERFGKFEDLEFGPFQKGVNIIEGPNEAGKSTLLSFLRYTLFGYPRLKSAPFRTENGSSAGGRIRSRREDGELMTLERQEGSKGGAFRILYPDGSISENEADRLNVLGNADEHLFRNVYAFTLDELSDAAILRDEALMERIMSAGYGTGKISPEAVRKRIQAKADERYRKRKQTAEFNELKAAIDQKEKEIEEREREQARYDPLLRELKELREKKEALREEEREKEKEADRIHRGLSLYPYFNRYREAEDVLERIGEPPPVDEEDEERMKELLEEEKDRRSELDELRRSLEKIDAELEEIRPDPDILAQEARIKELLGQRDLYSSHLQTRDEALREKEKAEKRFQERSKDLGTAVPEGEVREMDGIEEAKGIVKSFRQEFDALRERERDYDARLRERAPESALRTHHILLTGMGIFFLLALGAGMTGYPFFAVSLLLLGVGMAVLAWIATKRRQGTKDPIDTERKRIADQRAELEGRWQEWLRSQGFPLELGPDAALERLSGLGELIGIVRKKDEEERKAERSRERLDTLMEEVRSMPGVGEIGEEEVPAAIGELGECLEKAREKERDRKEKEGRSKELHEKKQELEESLERCRKGIDDLLRKAGVESSDAFFEKAAERKEWEEARRKKKEAWENIEDDVGKGNGEELLDFLRSNDKRELEERKRELDEALSTLREEKEARAREEALLDQEKEALEAKSDPSVLKNEREALRTRLRSSYEEWVSERLAIELLDRVRERYEREQQPALVRKASKHFDRITRGSYEQIRVPLGSEEDRNVRIFDRNGVPSDLSVLSRGTREQLLLSVRLAFIEEYEERREPLPVVMDEALVNFDRERAEASAETLMEFAQDRQLLLFTCHSGTKELFGEGTKLLRLDKG